MTMRKMLAVLATLAILCAVLPLGSLFSAVADDSNLIANGEFTDDISGWYASGGTTIEAADGTLHATYGEDWGFIGYNVNVKPNTDYTLTFDGKSINGGGISPKMNKTDWSGTVVSTDVALSADWQTFTWDFNSGDYNAFMLFFQSHHPASDGQQIWLDNVSLVEKAGGSEPEQPADDNLFVNGDFETGDNSGWEIWQSTTISADAAKDGAYGAHLIGNGGWGGMLNQTVAVEAGKEYKLSFWINVNNNGANVQVKNGAGASIEGAGGWFDGNKKDHKVEWIFTATDDSVLINFCGAGNGVAEDVYVDNFSLVCLSNGDEPDAPVDDALVKNGGFETGDLTNWINLWDGCGVEFVEGYESDYALHITAGSWSQVRQNMIPVEPNTDYVLTADYKYAENFALMIKKGDDSGDVASVMLESSSNWAKGTLEFNTGDLTAVCVLLIGWDGGGDAIIDNVVLAKKGGDTPVEPDEPDEPVVGGDILNATFDTDEFDGILSSSDISVADGELQFNVNKDWGNIYTELAVEANTDYEISFRAKSALGKNVWIKFHKADWTGDICQADASISTSWKDYTFTLNSGDNTSLWLLVQFAGYANEGETIWFDYITVKKVGGGSEPDAPAGNLIVNGDFETGDATGWETWQSTTISEEAAKDGSYGAHLVGDGGWGGMLNQTMKVEAGKEYKLSFWVYVVKTGVNVQVKDGSGNSIEGAGGWLDGKNQDKVISWTFVAPDDTVLINFCGSGSAPEEAYVDNFVLEAVEPVVSEGLIQDSGFESGALNPATTPGSVAGAWYNVWGSCDVSFEPGFDGSQYALTLDIATKWSHTRQDKIPVKPNTDYVVWARVKNTIGMSIVIKDGDDTTGITSDEQGAIAEDMTNSWKLHKVEFNSGDYTSVCVLLIAIAEDGGVGTFDDVQLYEKGKEPTAGETGPIKNAGFESAELTPWENLWGSCIVSFDADGYKHSAYALNFATTGQWQQVRQDAIAVEPNTDYVVVGYVKNPTDVNIVVKTGDDSANIAEVAITNDLSNKWVRAAVEFNSGDQTEICVLLISREANGNAIFDDVQLYKKGEEPTDVENDDDITEGPMVLDAFSATINRPVTPEANLILNGSFEDAEGGQWQSVLGNTLYVVDDETAPSGNKSLYFNTTGVEMGAKDKFIFYMDVEPNTDYIFSAWVKGAFISDDNRFNATIGVTDWKDNFAVYSPEGGYVFSTKERQIVPPCWDNEWHLRSVQFNSGVNIRVGIGFLGSNSQMWIDDIALYTVDNGVKYADGKQNTYISAMPSYDITKAGCDDEDNLLPNGNMEGNEVVEFWSDSMGYQNGFVTFPESKYEYGTSMKYTESYNPCGTHMIKWIDVEPNTEYTFSVNIRIVKSGEGRLSLIDSKKRDASEFLIVEFDQYTYDSEWFTIVSHFNSGAFDRIGICVVDGGGIALIDNMRLFEKSNVVDGGVKDNYVKPPYVFGSANDPHMVGGGSDDPDSPTTGVSVMGAVVAIALVPSAAAVAFKLRRKREDEE